MSQKILGLIICLACLSSCKSSQSLTDDAKSPALLSFEKGIVTQAEFERVYAKNNGGREAVAQHSTEQLREYLDLYINFKRKVFEAEDMGLDTTQAFKQEFSTYKKQLVQPYLSAREVEEQLIREAYERSGFKVDASHLLVSVGADASPEDTLQAYQKVMLYRDSIMSGQREFQAMAAKYSADPSAKENQGRLGYFTVFEMVYPFEDAAYTTEIGSVSQPVRTRFGYHLIKVHDKLVVGGTQRVAHVIVRVGDRYSAKTEEQAKQKIQEIYERLKQGEEFASLAKQFSDDRMSADKGGDLGTGRLLPEMESWKLKLQEGAFSEPFQTRFGWHVIQVTEVEKIAPFEEAKAELKQRIARDTRSQLSRTALLARIKRESNFQLQQANVDAFTATLDANFPQGTWVPDSAHQALYPQPLFTLGQGDAAQTRTIQDFIDHYRQTRARRPGKSPAQAANSVLDSYVEQQLLQYEEEQLPKKNPEFRYLLQEYRDGILLFTLMEQKVWKKAVEDTLGLQAYYDNHQSEFHKDQTVDVKEYRTSTEEAIQQVQAMLKQGLTDRQIDSALNQHSSLTLRSITQTYEKGEAGIPATIFEQEVGYQSEILKEDNAYRILVLDAKHEAGIPPFEKVKSEAITRYQDFLEQQWLAELAQKYPVEIHEKTFAKLFK